jgi:hypothetical protein
LKIEASKEEIVSVATYCYHNSEKITPRDVFHQYSDTIPTDKVQEILNYLRLEAIIRILPDNKIIWIYENGEM